MKLFFFIFFTLSIAFSQCDANNDSQLDVLDVIVQVNCILDGCWQSTTICQDIDGNIYETIQIGDQVWMAENLKTTKYSNGDEIIYIDNPNDWNNNFVGHYAAYNNDLLNVERCSSINSAVLIQVPLGASAFLL